VLLYLSGKGLVAACGVNCAVMSHDIYNLFSLFKPGEQRKVRHFSGRAQRVATWKIKDREQH
jgi:hypothetical protein